MSLSSLNSTALEEEIDATTPGIVFLGGELYHFKMERIDGTCPVIVDVKLWVLALPVRERIITMAMAMTAFILWAAFIGLFISH
jgi:hypothetical protein